MEISSFPLTVELIAQLVKSSKKYANPLDWTFYYIECLNKDRDHDLVIKVYSSLEKRKGLGYLQQDEVGYSIEICNAQRQTIFEQCFTICHEIAHLYIAHELYKQKVFNFLCFTYPDNVENLCEEIATILMHQKDLP
jgi:Zn-dependent peptidase ImmA (M78 family)